MSLGANDWTVESAMSATNKFGIWKVQCNTYHDSAISLKNYGDFSKICNTL